MDYESMLGHLNIPTLQQVQRRLQLKASIYDVAICAQWQLYPWRFSTPSSPSNYDRCNCSSCCFAIYWMHSWWLL